MPGKIKVKVLAGRNLPVMDRASDTTDAFVEIKFGGVTHKTDVCRKSLNPHWSNTEWYRFEVDESELQDEPLQLRLMDHDTYSANDAIGKVVISLAPLLAREANNAKGTTGPPGGAVLSGWIPVFDTMHGIRGELNVIVKVELFSDFNKYKTSSCGVQFFHCPMIPPGYKATSIHGFVEELVVNDDPEYQWIDKIRTPRASNEARQVAFIKLSNQVQRLVGLKAAELGANAVVGYQQEFDLEGEAGVVARAIGTAVSITLIPTPSQPINMISCTQQQLQKCLDILATDDESVTDLSQYYKHHQEELQKMINLLNPKGLSMLDSQENPDDDEEKVELVRKSSLNSYAGSVSLYQDDYVSRNSMRHLSEDQTDLNRLLNKKEDDESDSSGPIQKIKKLKTNFFTKRFTKRKGDKKNEKQDDTVSLKSNSSDTSRISLYDIKNELKKFKRLKKPKFAKSINKEDEGEGMASILARSVIHARTTLACITETQDSQAENSPSSTLRHTSESDPNVHVEDDKTKTTPLQEKNETDFKKVPEIQFSSLKNISSEDLPGHEPRVRRLSESCPTSPVAGRSDNLLKLPGDKGYYGSVSSALSGESSIYSSSEDEDDSSDLKTDTDDALETASSIVKSVMRQEADPAFIAQMDRKLTVIQNTPPKISESILTDFDKRTPHSTEAVLDHIETSKAPEKETKEFECKVEKAENGVEKPGLSVATVEPSTSKDAENEKLEEHKNSGATMRQLQSTTASTTPRIVAVTPKRLSEDLTAKDDKLIDKRHQEESKGLVHDATQTILVDKAQSVFPETTGTVHSTQLHEGFYNEKETAAHKKKDSKGSISTLMDKVHFHPHFFHHKKDGSSHDIRSGGLIQAAMQTILIDRAQSMIPDTPDPIPVHTEPDFGEIGKHHKHHEHDHKNKESTGLVHSALQTILIDNVQTVLPDSDAPIPIRTESDFGDETHKSHGHTKDRESTGLVHSALQTMLIDNVQSVLPDSKEPIPIRIEPIFDDTKSQKSYGKDRESTGLVHSALQTMLIDNIQSVLPDSEDPIPIRTEPIFDDTKSQKSYGKDKESTGLVHSALQTMLIDNIQSVLSDSTEPIPINLDFDAERENGKCKEMNSTGLVHSAMETMLLDKAQSLINPKAVTVESISENETDVIKDKVNKEESNDLINTSMETETILINKMQTMFPKHTESNNEEKRVEKIKDEFSELKSTGLVKNAMQAMLIDKDQPLVRSDNVPFELLIKSTNEVDDSNLKSWSENRKDNVSDPTKDTSEEITKQIETKEKQKKDTETRSKEKKEKKSLDERKKHFTRQDSIHSVTSNKMSNEANSHKVTKALVQHFHPLLSGGLETIPSADSNDSFDRSIDETSARTSEVLSEGSVDRSDAASAVTTTEGSVDRTGETNIASVCDNSHAACRFDRERERERDRDRDRSEKGSPKHARHESYGGREPPVQNSSLNASSTPVGIHRRSSDSDLSVTPKGGSLNTSIGNNVGSGGGAILRPSMNSNNLDMLEYPFLTMTEYPPGFIVHIGGAVCARSVKLVDGGGGGERGESAARAAWWTELRIELRAHARALRCNAVIAYRDSAAICEDVCVLSASGTAVVINLDCDFSADIEAPITVPNGSKAPFEESEDSCSIAHVPYSPGAGPYRAELSTCGGCRRARVPAVLLAACAKPNKLAAYPKSVTLTAVAARIRRAPPSAEPGARDISDQLPFLEYELHKLLLAKLRMQGANAIFSLQTQIAIGERCVMALASGTATKLTALPPPTLPRIKASEKEKDAIEMQKALWDTFTANRAANGYDVAGIPEQTAYGALPELEREEPPPLDLCADKDACVLELDEAEDVETARALSKRRVHLQAFNNSLRPATGAQPLAFTQVSRARLALSSGAGASAAAERQVARALDGAAYKLRRLVPAALNAAFHLELPEDEIQLVVSGTAIPLADPSKPEPSENGHSQASQSSQSSQHGQSSQNSQTDGNDDDIFELDEEQMKPVLTAQEMVEDKSVVNGQVGSAVSLSTLSNVAGGRARRLCALRLLFVRETTAVRELGGLSGFLHTFTCEVLAILRAYTAALGGNALTSFYITQLMLQDNAHKNQGQCLLSVGGDVVHVSY